MPFRELVFLVAALMAINALGIDSMLPALPHIAHALALTSENQQQWVITAYMLGMGASQIFFGPVVDRFGRRIPVLFCLALYAAACVLASMTTSFEGIIIARVLQGVGAAGARVICVAMVRDRYEGRAMARVMSLAFLIFLLVPMLAPSIGTLVMLVAPWQSIFHLLAAFALFVAIWIVLRAPETLHPEYRMPIRLAPLAAAMRRVVTTRTSIGYSVASALSFGSLVGFVNSAQQLFSGTFHGEERHFPVFFAFVAAGMAVAAMLNSRIVMRLGTRRVSHFAMTLFIILSALHFILSRVAGDDMIVFALFQCAMMFCTGLMGSNFSAMAMEPMGDIAGTASAVQGTISTLLGAMIGAAIGQSFNGTPVPLIIGYFLCSIGTLMLVLYAERGRLFKPQHSDPAPDQ